ncbi:hypothetical protein ACE60T_005840, partial [Salmonella enterica]
MRYILFVLMLIGGLLSFNSYAADCPAGIHLPAGSYKPYYSSGIDYFINLDGCEYKVLGFTVRPDQGDAVGEIISPDGFVSTGKPVKEGTPVSVSQDVPDEPDSLPADSTSDNQGGNSSTGGSSNGFPDGGSSGSSTPQPSEPEKPYP